MTSQMTTCYDPSMKALFSGILVILIVGIGGLVYRNAVEHPSQPITCPLDARVCPDGTSVKRTGMSCEFPACPQPNVTFSNIGISFAIPAGFVEQVEGPFADRWEVVTYNMNISSTSGSTLIIRQYPIS